MIEHIETLIKSEQIYKGQVVTLTKDIVTLENGNESTREIVHHNGGAAVIALDDNEYITLVRQYRHAFGEELTEIPAGKLELGEDPFEAAKRELGEEAGITASVYKSLGYIIPTCGYCTEKIYLYAAKELSEVAFNLDEDEFVTVIKIPLEEAIEMVMKNEITDSKTVVAILKLDYLLKNNKF